MRATGEGIVGGGRELWEGGEIWESVLRYGVHWRKCDGCYGILTRNASGDFPHCGVVAGLGFCQCCHVLSWV